MKASAFIAEAFLLQRMILSKRENSMGMRSGNSGRKEGLNMESLGQLSMLMISLWINS